MSLKVSKLAWSVATITVVVLQDVYYHIDLLAHMDRHSFFGRRVFPGVFFLVIFAANQN